MRTCWAGMPLNDSSELPTCRMVSIDFCLSISASPRRGFAWHRPRATCTCEQKYARGCGHRNTAPRFYFSNPNLTPNPLFSVVCQKVPQVEHDHNILKASINFGTRDADNRTCAFLGPRRLQAHRVENHLNTTSAAYNRDRSAIQPVSVSL